MKKLGLLGFIAILFFACQNNPQSTEKVGDYDLFGQKLDAEGALTQTEMLEKYENMKPGDTATVKFSSKVSQVCKKKGCWMKLELDPETTAMVKFKDYDFFVPKNADGSEAVVEGKAFVSEISVEELKHYAQDAGKSEEEISAITSPELSYNFEATGVLLK